MDVDELRQSIFDEAEGATRVQTEELVEGANPNGASRALLCGSCLSVVGGWLLLWLLFPLFASILTCKY